MAKQKMDIQDGPLVEDADLVRTLRAAKEGNRQAFGQLIERYEIGVFVTLYQRLGNHAVAQELCEQVFIRALQEIDQLQDPAAFGQWLQSIAERMSLGRAVAPAPLVAKSDVLKAAYAERENPPADSQPDDSSADPRLNVFAHGPLLEIVEQFRERLLEEASNIAGKQPIDANHLEEACKILFAKDPNSHWLTLNRRRLYLIQKEVSGNISSSELAELEQLQAKADRYMSEAAPRPLEALWDLREKLLRAKSDAHDGSQK